MGRNLKTLEYKAEAPSAAFPSTTLKAYLKQVDVPSLGKIEKQLLDVCFPVFSALHWTKDGVSKLGIENLFTSKGYYKMRGGPARRYDGGPDLPAGRYFSVCTDNSGNDGGTLCYELTSYWDGGTGVFAGLSDSTVHNDAIEAMGLRAEADRSPFLFVGYCDISTVQVTPDGDPILGNPKRAFLLPLSLFQVTCENVLDLRLPSAQDWLVSRCLQARNGSPDRFGFQHVLCNLMSPYPGGNVFHESLGAWLRAHGCLGLVFPSARNDVRVAASDAYIQDSAGWNFVLYAGAPKPQASSDLQMPFPWLTGTEIGASVLGGQDGDLRLWVVRDVTLGEWRRVYYEIRRGRGEKVFGPGPLFEPYVESRLNDSDFAHYFEPLRALTGMAGE